MNSKSELDNHANMMVAGSQCVVFDDTKKTCTVNSFSESAGRLDNIRIVDVVVQCQIFRFLFSNLIFLLFINYICINFYHQILIKKY